MRFCKPCGVTKPISEFNVDSKESGGHRYYCKACAKEKKRVYLLKKATMGQVDHKKVFAAGYYKGLRESESKGEIMNQSRFDAVYRGLSAQAKKVYEALPISEPWGPSQIMQELHRRNISMSDMRVVIGCINTMIDVGCVEEPTKGMFVRAEIREKQATAPILKEIKQKEPEVKQDAAKQTETETSPIDRLSLLSRRLRDLASDMDDAAIALAEQAQKNESETVKMRQLQALLKSLG